MSKLGDYFLSGMLCDIMSTDVFYSLISFIISSRRGQPCLVKKLLTHFILSLIEHLNVLIHKLYSTIYKNYMKQQDFHQGRVYSKSSLFEILIYSIISFA